MKMEQIIKHKNKILYGIALGIVLCIWFRMHTYVISIVPWGVHLDEAGLGYNAYCIANWGVDRYLNYMPVYTRNFNSGQSALYTYMCVILIKFLGTGTRVLRLPALIFSFITLVSGFFIVREKYGKNWALFAAFLIAVLPYFTQQARFGLDCNLMLGCVTLATWVFIVALKYDRWYWYLIDGLLWMVTLYSYALSYVIVPVFLGIMVIYLLITRRVKLKKVIIAGVPVLLGAIPLILMVLINRFGWEPVVTPFFSIPRLEADRSSELSFNGMFGNFCVMLHNLFIYDEMDYNSLWGFHTMYLFSIPFVAAGAVISVIDSVKSIKRRECDISLIMTVYCFAQLLTGSMIVNTCINQMNAVFFTFVYFIVAAVRVLFYGIKWCTAYGMRHKLIKETPLFRSLACIAVAIVIAGYTERFVLFYDYYFNSYPRTNYPQFLFNGRLDDILAEFGNDFGGKTVYIEAPHIYYLLGSGISPYGLDLTDGMSEYGNIHFIDEAHVMPDFIDPEAIYIVRETSFKYRDFVQEHFNTETWSGFYRIYRNE